MSALPRESQCMSTSAKSSSKSKKSTFLQRINIRFPWLKLVAVLIIGLIAILDLLDLTISRANETYHYISIAPMSQHVRITERDITGKKLVALTFDDGPSNLTTPTLLDTLKNRDVPATFFVLGNMARNNPELVKRMEKEGHDIASHTMYHQNLIRITPAAVQSDINEANSVFWDILDHAPKYTRPPYGNINDAVRNNVGTPMILWSVDTLDWKSKNPDAIVSTAMSEIYDGAIILMHDIYPTSVDAIPTLIDKIRESGYEFVTITELAKVRNVSLENGAVYYSLKP